MKVHCCLLAFAPQCLSFLGFRPLLSWTLDRLPDVRGLTGTTVVCNPKQRAALADIVGEEIELLEKPKDCQTLEHIYQWLAMKHNPHRLLALDWGAPFLPAGKIEEVIEEGCKQTSGYTAAVVPRHGHIEDGSGWGRGSAIVVEVGPRVFRPNHLRVEQPWHGKHLHAIRVNAVEGHRFETPQGELIARALVENGTV